MLFGSHVLKDPRAAARVVLRDGPVHYVPMLRAWLITSHRAILSILDDSELSFTTTTMRSDANRELEPLRMLRDLEPSRACELMLRYFSRLHDLQVLTQRVTDDLLDRLLACGGVFDFVSEFAHSLSTRVIAALLGVPEHEHRRIQVWSEDISPAFRLQDLAVMKRCQRSMLELRSFMRGILIERREHPGADVLSELVAAEHDGLIDPDALISHCMVLLFVGQETAARWLANGLAALLDHPEQLERLRAQPELMPLAIDEMLRWEGPASVLVRRSGPEGQLVGDVWIPPRQPVMLGLVTGNLDARAFTDPLRFDVGRDESDNLAYGIGPHYYLGAALAQVAFTTLLRRAPGLHRVDEPKWRLDLPLGRRMERMLVALR